MSRPNIVNLELEDMATYYGKDSNTEKYIQTLEAEVERLQAQLNAAKRGMDSAAAAGRLMLEKGQKLAAENSPEAIESEREANAVLTAENERLQVELERYSMSAGAADQFRREALAMRQALGFDKYGDDIAPIDLLSALDHRDAEVIDRLVDDLDFVYSESCGHALSVDAILEYANQLRQQAKESKDDN